MNEEATPPDQRGRTKAYALRIIKEFGLLPKTAVAKVPGRQVLRSVTSAEANYRETYGARSKAEFISKPGDCLRELEKPACWLELRVESGCVVANRLSTLREETDGLIAIFPRMVKRSQLSN